MIIKKFNCLVYNKYLIKINYNFFDINCIYYLRKLIINFYEKKNKVKLFKTPKITKYEFQINNNLINIKIENTF